jgi:hypothetical protein
MGVRWALCGFKGRGLEMLFDAIAFCDKLMYYVVLE